MTVIAEVTTYPLDKGISLSGYVKKAIKVLDESGYDYVIGPMATAIEAETVEELLVLIGKMHNAIADECARISTTIRIDDRRDREDMGRMKEKMKAVRPD